MQLLFQDINVENQNSSIFISGMLLTKVIQLIFILISTNLLELKNTLKIPYYFWLIFLFPIITLIFFVNLQSYLFINNENRFLFSTLIFVLLISNFFSFFLFIILLNNLKIKNDFILLKTKDELADLNYQLLRKQFDNNFSILHKVKDNMFKIINYTNHSDYSSVNSCAINLYKDINNIMSYTINGPESLNLVIDDSLKIITENNIKLKTQLLYKDFSFIKIFDQLTLFSSLLSLAIENCLKAESKTIIIKSNKINNLIILSILFEITDEIKNNPYFIQLNEITKKYNSNVSIEYKTNNYINIFINFAENIEK